MKELLSAYVALDIAESTAKIAAVCRAIAEAICLPDSYGGAGQFWGGEILVRRADETRKRSRRYMPIQIVGDGRTGLTLSMTLGTKDEMFTVQWWQVVPHLQTIPEEEHLQAVVANVSKLTAKWLMEHGWVPVDPDENSEV